MTTRSSRVYLDLLNGVAENLVEHGFKRIVFVNAARLTGADDKE
jgi:creatinine amidohydrolase/Fe(II)-dependent formamide hydrolase-like protein